MIRIALKRSPTLKKSEAELQVSVSDTSQARGALLPSINLNSSVTTKDNPANLSSSSVATSIVSNTSEEYSVYLEATQPIYSGGVLSALALSHQVEDVKRLSLVNETQELIASVTQAYYQVAEQARLLAAAEQNVKTLSQHAATIGRYEKIGRARKTDRLQAQVNLAMAQAEVKKIETDLIAAKGDLRKLLALEDIPNIELPKDLLKIQYEKIKLDEAVEKAMRANPEIQILNVNLEKVKYEKSVALSSDMPELKLSGQVGYRSPNRPDWFEDTSEYTQVALNLKVPLFSGLSSLAKRRGFEQQKMIATREVELKKLNISAGLHSAVADLESTIDRLEMARQASENASAALTLAGRDYQQGLISSQDLVGVQRTRYDAEKLFVSTQFVYFNTLLKARRLMGVQLEKIYAEN
ncbi:MAG: TolC family protein [Bdellovibrionales bacterium]|nr:TolC family protein [Bdellovibrionales bacterium]